jgi:hypothetical protein
MSSSTLEGLPLSGESGLSKKCPLFNSETGDIFGRLKRFPMGSELAEREDVSELKLSRELIEFSDGGGSFIRGETLSEVALVILAGNSFRKLLLVSGARSFPGGKELGESEDASEAELPFELIECSEGGYSPDSDGGPRGFITTDLIEGNRRDIGIDRDSSLDLFSARDVDDISIGRSALNLLNASRCGGDAGFVLDFEGELLRDINGLISIVVLNSFSCCWTFQARKGESPSKRSVSSRYRFSLCIRMHSSSSFALHSTESSRSRLSRPRSTSLRASPFFILHFLIKTHSNVVGMFDL